MFLLSIVVLNLVHLISTSPLSEDGALSITPMIIGGFEINIDNVPHQVSLQTTNRYHFCGGSLITASIVITAAHCFE